jgi:hypothetical protein
VSREQQAKGDFDHVGINAQRRAISSFGAQTKVYYTALKGSTALAGVGVRQNGYHL